MKANKEKLVDELASVVEQLKAMGAKRIILFGSLARGSIRLSSDIDLIALFKDEKNFKERMKYIYNLLDTSEAVDVLAYNFEEFERVRKRPFFKNILSYGKIIYGE